MAELICKGYKMNRYKNRSQERLWRCWARPRTHVARRIFNARCILEVANDCGRSLTSFLWSISLKRTHLSVPRPTETCIKVATSHKAQNGSLPVETFHQATCSEFCFILPKSDVQRKRPNDQKYATGIMHQSRCSFSNVWENTQVTRTEYAHTSQSFSRWDRV